MNSTCITIYKPLTEVIDFQGDKYYSTLSVEELEQAMNAKERLYFDFSKSGVKVSNIRKYWPADPEVVASEWAIQELTSEQKKYYAGSLAIFQEKYKGTRPLTKALIEAFIICAKESRVYWVATS